MADDDDFDVDAWLDGYTLPTRTVDIFQRPDLADEVPRLEAEMAQLGQSTTDDDESVPERVRALAKRIEQAQAELEASKKTFTFQAVPWDEWYDLQLKNPATDDEAKKNPHATVGEEFRIKAIARSSLTPKLKESTVLRMKQMRADDFDRMWFTVLAATEGAVQVPKSGLATAVLRKFDERLTNRSQRRSRGASGRAANGKASRSTSTTKKGGSSGRSRRTTPNGSKRTGG